MTDRLNKIFEQLPFCKVFADIGCDHGYMAKAMLKSGKAEKVIISDISAKCLSKAQSLLDKEVKENKAISVVSNGFKRLPTHDLALIAGMGGEEIVSILNEAKVLPDNLVLQPMKNSDRVRICAVGLGYKITRDFVFYSAGKYYDLIVLEKGVDSLTEEEIEFGRTNLVERPLAFINMLKEKADKLFEYSLRVGLDENDKRELLKRREKLIKYVES